MGMALKLLTISQRLEERKPSLQKPPQLIIKADPEGDSADQVQKEANSDSKPEDENKSERDGADQIQKEAKGNSEPKDQNKSEEEDADQGKQEVKSNSKTDDKNKKVDEKL